jgi:hypothetical protein
MKLKILLKTKKKSVKLLHLTLLNQPYKFMSHQFHAAL